MGSLCLKTEANTVLKSVITNLIYFLYDPKKGLQVKQKWSHSAIILKLSIRRKKEDFICHMANGRPDYIKLEVHNMAHIIFKQPNGLFCILSTVTNCPIKWNLTKQELIFYEMMQEKEISKEKLKNCDFKSFGLIDAYFIENPLMTKKDFESVKEECSKKPDYKNPDFYVEDVSLPYLLKIKNKYELQLKKSKIKLKYNDPATKETADLKNKIQYCETMLGIISWFLAFNYETDEQAR